MGESVSTYKAAQGTALSKRPMRDLTEAQRQQIALEVLKAYQQGEEVADLAPNYGVSDVTLYALLVRDHEEEWKQAQISRAIAKKARADRDLEELRLNLRDEEAHHDGVSLARVQQRIKIAEVQCKRAEWELERVYRRVYGQDAPAQLAQIVINVQNMRDMGTVGSQPTDVLSAKVESDT